MTIWTYQDLSRDSALLSVSGNCPFCKTKLESMPLKDWEVTKGGHYWRDSASASICSMCGWWQASRDRLDHPIPAVKQHVTHEASAASLKELDLKDIDTPLSEVRSYLVARYESRFSVHPRLFEQTVASVFSDFGYDAIVTGYTADDGLDVILTDTSSRIGVQVKRYRNSIEVEQIRSLAGALLLANMTEGMFVTTSDFQRGAERTVKKFNTRGYAIRLLDATRFYEALEMKQRPMFRTKEEFLELNPLKRMTTLSHFEGI